MTIECFRLISHSLTFRIQVIQENMQIIKPSLIGILFVSEVRKMREGYYIDTSQEVLEQHIDLPDVNPVIRFCSSLKTKPTRSFGLNQTIKKRNGHGKNC